VEAMLRGGWRHDVLLHNPGQSIVAIDPEREVEDSARWARALHVSNLGLRGVSRGRQQNSTELISTQASRSTAAFLETHAGSTVGGQSTLKRQRNCLHFCRILASLSD